MIQSLAELKRTLTKGTQIRQIWNFREGDVNHLFTIEKVQTQEVAASCPTFPNLQDQLYWMAFHKRSDVIFTERGWIKMLRGERVAEYELLA